MKFLRIRQVMQLTGLSRMTIYRLELAGRFPKRRRLSENSVAWLESDIAAWRTPARSPICGQLLAARLGYGRDLPVAQARKAKLRNDGKLAGMVVSSAFDDLGDPRECSLSTLSRQPEASTLGKPGSADP
jgi:prophage regulatory protein